MAAHPTSRPERPPDDPAGAVALAFALGLHETAWDIAHREGLTTFERGCRCWRCLRERARRDFSGPQKAPPQPRQPWDEAA